MKSIIILFLLIVRVYIDCAVRTPVNKSPVEGMLRFHNYTQFHKRHEHHEMARDEENQRIADRFFLRFPTNHNYDVIQRDHEVLRPPITYHNNLLNQPVNVGVYFFPN
jgi:hypothetical protein